MDDDIKTLRDHLTTLRRRKWYFGVPAAALFMMALLAALLWPPTYRSEATILVAQAQIPADLVGSVVGDYIERRLDAISRRILASENLLKIIERYDLYPEERRRLPISAVVDEMRDDIRRKVISTEVVDPRSGTSTESTVAFQVAFDHRQASTAQQITNELVSLYLNENLRQRRELATGTANFLRGERENAEQRILEIENQLAAFKREHSGSLPDELQYNQQAMARADQELSDLGRQIQFLTERESYLQTQLALTDPRQYYGDGGEAAGPAGRLEALRTKLTTLIGRYGPEHPDVVKLKREVDALEGALGVGPGTAALEQQRARLRRELDSLGQYTADHPDVQSLTRQLAAVEAELRSAAQSRDAGSATRPTNPAYIQLDAQLNAARAELAAIQDQRVEVREKLGGYEARLAKTPGVEREYGRLQRELRDAVALRDELAKKETIADLGQSLEAEQKAERFSLIEPPSVPTTPIKPQRLLIVMIGLALALGSGLGTVMVAETLDDGVYSAKEMISITGEAPLAVIPTVATTGDHRRAWSIRAAAAASVLVILSAGVWWLHARHGPLDLAWYDFQRRVLTNVTP